MEEEVPFQCRHDMDVPLSGRPNPALIYHAIDAVNLSLQRFSYVRVTVFSAKVSIFCCCLKTTFADNILPAVLIVVLPTFPASF